MIESKLKKKSFA